MRRPPGVAAVARQGERGESERLLRAGFAAMARRSFPAYTRLVTETASLTSLARAGGCAAKYSAARLETLLAGFVPGQAEDLLVGLDPADDAAVYRLDDERALVFTVDFFPPVVDDPRDFGAIAATNALNDVFAMGGPPLLALSITAFPEELPTEVLGEVLAGADEAVRAAGRCSPAGTRSATPSRSTGSRSSAPSIRTGSGRRARAQPGDALFLTKPLGTGLVLQAQRDGLAPDGALAAAVAAMKTLNRDAADALRPFSPNAVTDVTGFGLLGHAHEMAERSGVRLRSRRRVAAGAAGRARAGRGRRAHRRRPPEPRVRRAARRRRRRRGGRGARATTRRPPVGLLISLPADEGGRARGDVRGPDLFLRADRPRRGRAAGVSLELAGP